ncbi:hypothetical protein Fleli_0518 [Bernardetia litoralis DSM 6794]|uniref:Uncharacterized protein n=1 Tax=Bernardetia litoralis (strain ATCC 23117 / DSM 6794 / NBRC 15988 / NCIMB 1366 / Fx l1 / Sio-4) TaxID=880071 RepID=I4AGA8_BERLS|nr:hypothetical protein [Bernardetia litoralis]AFM02993.1 hypothetical protein Fleli_0518 [Bernardetia litoralis DSM 6794]
MFCSYKFCLSIIFLVLINGLSNFSFAQNIISNDERKLFTSIENLEPLGIVYENASAGEEIEKEDYGDGSLLYTYEFEDSDLWMHELIWIESSAQAAVFTYEAYGEASKTYLSEGLILSTFRIINLPNSNADVVVADVYNDKQKKVGSIVRFKERNVSGMFILIGLEFDEIVMKKFLNTEFQRMSQMCSKLSLWK